MWALGKLKNKLVILFFSFLLIIIIGIIDYVTSTELTLSVFYLIPISLHALYKGTDRVLVIINSFLASLVWALIIYQDKYYSSNFYTIWNAFIIFSFFLTTGLLLFFIKKKYEEIKELNQHLAQLNEEKNKFIGIAAHDLRSPIAIINSFSDLLLTDYSKSANPESSRIVGYIKETSDNALVLLKNLLDISVIESGKINISLKKQHYYEFIKKSISLNQILADKKNIIITLETVEEEIILNFDEHYLSEVINNLLSNAIKYSPSNSDITIRITMTEKESVLTEVIDKGRGIPAEEQFKLFNYFQKTTTTPTSGEKSTGLGLAIAKKIIQEHSGFIGVNSIFGYGSNFYYELF